MHYFTTFLLLAWGSIALLAQDTTAPAATPAAETAVSPAPIASGPSPDANPDAGATSSPEPAPEPAATPEMVGEDVIPLPPEDAAFTDPNAFIPEDASTLPDLPPAPTGPSASELERKLKVRYKEVRTRVDKDPDVRSLLEQALTAKTFEDERAAYREYYRLLFKKMKKVDKALTERCDTMEKAYLDRLAQTRIEPTIPLKPPPTPKPLTN